MGRKPLMDAMILYKCVYQRKVLGRTVAFTFYIIIRVTFFHEGTRQD